MVSVSHNVKRDELGDFLRRRREALAPEDIGLRSTGRRRTPGLRRDEVAAMATVSAVYYEQLEQGRGARPSAAVLHGLAGALRLSADERDHLYRLAGQAAPAARDPAGFVDAGLLSVLTAVERTMPGFIADDLGTVVAQNLLNTALFGSFTERPGREANLVWQWFTSPTWRFKLEPAEQHEQTGRAYVADLRAITAQREGDTDAADLVAALLDASAEFAALWDDHEVSALHCSTKRVVDDRVGRLDLDCVVVLSPLSRQRMLLMKPVPGSGAEERLALLDSLLR